MVSYSFTDDMLILQIPIYVKHYQQQTLELFSLQTVLGDIIQTENLQMKIMPILG